MSPPATAHAHCDIPCGIYDPKPAQIAADTVIKMVQLITDLGAPGSEALAVKAHTSQVARYTLVKEEHAQICKKELLILWSDYFKPEHLSMFSDLHDNFWKAAKLCSRNKQNVDMQAAQELRAAVDHIAEMFWKTKKAA
jgi:nickel superoxide dismutase